MLDRDVQHVACQYLEALNSPLSLSVWLMMKYGEWEQIAVKRTDPRAYEAQDVDKFRRDYLATELLRKFPALPIKADPKKVAIEKFWESEQQCKRTNDRLTPFVHRYYYDIRDGEVYDFIDRVRKNIAMVLGVLPDELDLRYGPGSTYESKELPVSRCLKRNLTLGDKFQQQLHLTPSALCFQPLLERTAVGRARVRAFRSDLLPVTVRGNRFFSVPKDATTERGACAEPGGNVQVQMGLGRAIRARLKRTGIDLEVGQQVHGSRALEASKDGSLATIDLRSASDTICRKVVELLFPRLWFETLDCARSPYTLMPNPSGGGKGVWVRLEKFSSMGNGFTFEVETLLFLGICRAVVPEREWPNVHVYGDDIIVPSRWAGDVLAALAFFGFTPNERKTFTTSDFRESCGTDAFAGVQIKAFRWDSVPQSPVDWISTHNSIHRSLSEWLLDGCMQPVKAAIRSKVPSHLWLYGPEWYGDAVVHSREWRRLCRVAKVEDGIVYGKALKAESRLVALDYFHPEVQFALALYGVDPEGLAYRPSEDEPPSYTLTYLSFS